MANVHVTFRDAVQVGGSSIISREPRVSESRTSSGSSAATAITAVDGEVIQISTDGAIRVAVGSAPTAASGSGDMLTAGTYQLGLAKAGDKVAFIDV
ncbi:MAG: hypothetical protein ACPGFA_12140 [Pikeienuella sp.]